MKKAMAFLIAAAVLFTGMGTAGAATPLRQMYDSVYTLLFHTGNVTLKGHAEFFLDGERFKTADGTYVQDGDRSFWEYKLLTPRENGQERESGYTVIANGKKIYVMEAIYPGVYKTGTDDSQSTVLRNSVQMDLMSGLVRMLADQSDTLLGPDAVTVVTEDENGTEIRVRLGEDVPETVNTLLNVLAQFGAKRWFGTDFDFVTERDMAPMEAYLTVTAGILYTTRSFSLQSADILLRRDAEGCPERIEGSVSVCLHTGRDGERMLKADFRAEVSDRGNSYVRRFSPEEYGVVLPEGAADFTDYIE